MAVAASAVPSSAPFRPPAPRPRTKPLSAVGMICQLWRNPLQIWSNAHFEHPVLIGRTVLGLRAVVSDPAGVRRVLLDNATNYRKDALQLRVLRPGLGTGLLTVDGEGWRKQRRALAPLFSPRQVADFAPAMHRVARALVERMGVGRDGRLVEVSEEMGRTALEVLEQTLFSQGLARGASEFQRAVAAYFNTIGRLDPLDLLGAPKFLPRLGRLRGGEAVAVFTRAGRGMSLDDVRANIVTFISAGHETTANALTWTLFLLSQAPDWQQRVEAELDAEFDPGLDDDPLARLPVTRAALEEAMRLYPPAATLSREAIGEDWLAGARIPAGTTVTVAPYLLHRHRRLWKDPDAFDPERFLGANRDAIDRYAYIPFGAGPRV